MPINGLPDAWTTERNPVATMFSPPTTTANLVKTSQPAIARPTRIHTPTLAPVRPTGNITINATPDEFASLILALNRATGNGQPQVRVTQDPIAMGLIGFGVLCLTGIGGYAIASMAAQSPAAVQKAELDRIERISARESAQTRKMAEKALEKGNFCIAWSCR
jgi:hypothetical protein